MVRRGEDGFSLLEVLVAFTILSLSLGVILQIFGTGLRGATVAKDYTRATQLAQSKLAVVTLERPLTKKTKTGKFDEHSQFRWQAKVVPYRDPTLEGRLQKPTLRPFKVTVAVHWQQGTKKRKVELTTLRLAKPQ